MELMNLTIFDMNKFYALTAMSGLAIYYLGNPPQEQDQPIIQETIRIQRFRQNLDRARSVLSRWMIFHADSILLSLLGYKMVFLIVLAMPGSWAFGWKVFC